MSPPLRFRPFLAAVLFLSLMGVARGEPIAPDPARPPVEVVALQLEALRNNDAPEADAGIAQTFALAHPNNRKMTGPLDRFARMIKSPAYRHLLDHKSHEIKKLAGDDTTNVFLVVIETPGGKVFEYLWEVRLVEGGAEKGAWGTTKVSVPRDGGRGI